MPKKTKKHEAEELRELFQESLERRGLLTDGYLIKVKVPDGLLVLLNSRDEGLADGETCTILDGEIKAFDDLQAVLISRDEGRLRMSESYEGVVRHATNDTVTVLFEVDDDLVEQTYRKSQFVDGRLPEVGDRLAVFVHVAKLPESDEEPAGGTTSGASSEQKRKRRKNVVPLPREF